ncbi:hypothetical protein [Rosistilla oblonga]|uniref:hypothetical protein n=1 Tax=Rosistilla oblonga TaxID=2527990 RepID=UPI003A980922
MTKDSITEIDEEHEVPPSTQLASVIVDALVSEGLTSPSRKDSLAIKLATGQISAEEWRTEIAAQTRESEKKQKGAES